MFTDVIPNHTTYNGDARSSSPPLPKYTNGALSWIGTLGFDSSIRINFAVDVDTVYKGVISNTAMIDNSLIAHPVTRIMYSMFTDSPYLLLDKISIPEKPGANKQMSYALRLENRGQPAFKEPVTVTDMLPTNTTL